VGEQIDESEEHLARRDFATGDVEHDTTVGEHGPVGKSDGGKTPTGGPDELANGLDPVEQASRRVRGEDESLCPALDDIPLGTAGIEASNGRTEHEGNAVGTVEWVECDADREWETSYLPNGGLQLACSEVQQRSLHRRYDELAVPIENPTIFRRATRDLAWRG
jgi:hypothetical protein